MDIFKDFLEKNPSKILGSIKETTDQWGKADITIVGDVDNINQIDVADSLLPSKNKEVVNVKIQQYSEEELTKRRKKAIRITKSNNGYQEKTAFKTKTRTKKKKGFQLIVPGDNEQPTYTFEESNKLLNEGISNDVIQVWVWYSKKIGVQLNEYAQSLIPISSDDWFSNQMKLGNICYDARTQEYLPSIIYYSGNIYDKLEELKNFENTYKSENLEEQFLRQYKGLKNIIPHPLKVTGEENERLVLSVLSKFVREFNIVFNETDDTILEHFQTYLRELDSSEMKFDIPAWNITSYYIRGDRMPNHWDKFEKVNVKRKSAQECVHQMSIFLSTEIDEKSQQEIELGWNKTHNGFIDVTYDKIPLFMEFSKFFKKGLLGIRPAQREGIAFQTSNGTGIIAYDVGVGKTLTAILNIGYALQNGLCKRPLIVVPKPTYDKWISEINGVYKGDKLIGSGLLPQYPIIDLFNLDKKRQAALFDESGNFIGIPENSISICTYEGMQRIGFSDDMEGSFIGDLTEILNQGFADQSERQKALENEKLTKMIGVAQENTIINIDEAQFDYFTIDEGHNFNKIFASVKGETSGNGRDKSNYQIRGTQSSRAVKAFFLSSYIQRTTKFGNICLLTATPFTNNPLEVYNILALTNISRLAEKGLKSISSFFDNYVNQTFEKVIKSTGEIVESAVIKGWNNKISLQKILFSYMNYKSGEDANIQRPVKWTLPKLSEVVDGSVIPLSGKDQVPTYLKPTDEQKSIQKEISRWLVAQLQDEELSKKAPYLVADIMAKKNCISPYIYNAINPFDIAPKDFIKSSPKLSYAMDCVKSVRDWHIKDGSSVSGQVIYINGGVEYLFLIKEYLIESIGYKRKAHEYKKNKFYDEVEILASSGNFKRKDEEKEEIKDLFNKGVIKVVIGTSTIREGIDLQVQSSCLYALWVDWNPTSYKQLEGRIWRFGNEFANVRIVTPLLVGSSDAFTYQKLEEKTARINDIFDRNDKSNMLDVGEEDREAVKWALVDDLTEIAKAKIKDKLQDLGKEKLVAKENVDRIDGTGYDIEKVEKAKTKIQTFIDNYFQYVDLSLLTEDYKKGNLFTDYAAIKTQREAIKTLLGADNYSLTYGFEREVDQTGWNITQLKKDYKKLDRLESQIKDKFGVSIYSGELDQVKENIENDIIHINEEMQEVMSPENQAKLLAELEAERKKFNSGIGNYSDTVNKFIDLNYLLGDKISEQQLPVQSKIEVVANVEKPPLKESEPIEINESGEISAPNSEDLAKRLKILNMMAAKNPAVKPRIKILELMIAKGTLLFHL